MQRKGDVRDGSPVSIDQRATKAGKFLTHVYFDDATSRKTDLPLGEVKLHVNVVEYSTLRILSQEARVRLIVRMPAMPEMGEEIIETTRGSDGGYSGAIFLSMAGAWEIVIDIADQSQEDQYVYTATAK